MSDRIILNEKELAEVTDGYWVNLAPSERFQISGVNHLYKEIKPGDLFVVYDGWKRKKGTNKDKIKQAMSNGAIAVLTADANERHLSAPALVVKDTYQALRCIALETSKRSEAKRILVIGSYGKTAFKTHLYHLIKTQIKAHATFNSFNRVTSTYNNLASLKENTELLIIEQPISRKGRSRRRAGYVTPDIIVLTSIGHEHIDIFSSVENIIKHKLSTLNALKADGKVIIPKSDRYFEEIKSELENYSHVKPLTFGLDTDCNAQLLSKEFENFGWNIIARIENVTLSYRLPFPEYYAPLASLSELLSAYHLGLDIHQAAARYSTVENYDSSGKLYQVNTLDKTFYLYDQSYRGGVEGYQAFFRTLRQLTPQSGGKKIVLTSEFVDYKDGEIEFLDPTVFPQLIKDAQIDQLYSIENFKLHSHLLPPETHWIAHHDNVEDICDVVLNNISNGDLLCVKAIYESHMPRFIKYLSQQENVHLIDINKA